MNLEALFDGERAALVSKLGLMLGGDRDAGEDLAQETFARAWQRMPGGLSADEQRAWLRTTSRNLAIDELRRRARRPLAAVDHEQLASLTAGAAPEPDAAREALSRLPAHERFLILLRFEAGFSHAAIAQLFGISEEAARKRAARARASFLQAYRVARSSRTPLVLLLIREDDPAPYVAWLQGAGARVRRVHRAPSERELALADGLVFTGSCVDIHSSLYGEEPRALLGGSDPVQDRVDLAVLNATLALDVPFVGICRGHQLLNIASGGTLYQDVVEDGATRERHNNRQHRVTTAPAGIARRLIGRSALVRSEHHQAVRRLGRHLGVVATSSDGVVETIERRDRSFALGLQWRPEVPGDVPGRLVGEALVEAAAARAAA